MMWTILIDATAWFGGGLCMFLLLRNISWCVRLVQTGVNEGWGEAQAEAFAVRRFPQWAVRMGTVCLSVLMLLAIKPVVLREVWIWTNPGKVSALSFMVCGAALLGWRWHFYTSQKALSWASMVLLAVAALLLAFNFKGGVL